MDSKRCIRCTVAVPLDQFSKNRAAADGLQAYCRPCHSAIKKERYTVLKSRPVQPPLMGTKICIRCQEALPVTAFGFNRVQQDQLSIYCRACYSAHRRHLYQTDAKHRAARQAAHRRKYAKNPEAAKAYAWAHHLKSHYHMTQEDWDAMAETQGHRCALCGNKRRLVVDHSHTTGQVRGLLCAGCNHALGMLVGDDPARVDRVREYLIHGYSIVSEHN